MQRHYARLSPSHQSVDESSRCRLDAASNGVISPCLPMSGLVNTIPGLVSIVSSVYGQFIQFMPSLVGMNLSRSVCQPCVRPGQ